MASYARPSSPRSSPEGAQLHLGVQNLMNYAHWITAECFFMLRYSSASPSPAGAQLLLTHCLAGWHRLHAAFVCLLAWMAIWYFICRICMVYGREMLVAWIAYSSIGWHSSALVDLPSSEEQKMFLPGILWAGWLREHPNHRQFPVLRPVDTITGGYCITFSTIRDLKQLDLTMNPQEWILERFSCIVLSSFIKVPLLFFGGGLL